MAILERWQQKARASSSTNSLRHLQCYGTGWSVFEPSCPELFKGGLFGFFFFYGAYVIQHCFTFRPSDSTVSEDAVGAKCKDGPLLVVHVRDLLLTNYPEFLNKSLSKQRFTINPYDNLGKDSRRKTTKGSTKDLPSI